MGSPTASPKQASPLPWLTILLASLLAVATLQAQGASQDHERSARDLLRQAGTYFEAHPYLEPGAELRAKRSHEALMNLRDSYEREREVRGDPKPIAAIWRRQQAELDGLVGQARAALEALPARTHGLNPSEWRPATLFTYVFLHSGVWHLAGNLLLLLLLGVYLEPAVGAARSFLTVVAGTLGAGLGYGFSLPGVDHVLIGSSGLLAGLLIVFAWDLRESRSEGFYALAVVGGMVWLALPSWLGVPWSLQHPGVDLLGPLPSAQLVYWSYGGGIVGAFSAHVLLGVLVGRDRESAGRTHSAKTSTGSASLDKALAARGAGREEDAFQQLTVLVAKEPENLDAALLLSDVSRSLGRHDKADAAMLRAIKIEAKGPETTSAVRHWIDLTQREIPRAADPALLIRMATLLRHHDHPRASSDALREALARATGSNAAPVAARVARAAQELDPRIAHDAAWRALGSTDLTLEERQNLEDLLAVVIPRLPGGEVTLSKAWSRDPDAPEAIDIDTQATRILDVVRAVPVELDEDGLHIATAGGSKKRVLYDRVEAVAVAAVHGLSEKPVLVLDLVLNWRDSRATGLRVVRARADRFDPRTLVSASSPVEAFRAFVLLLLERAEADALPDRDSVLGKPFATFEELALYERSVLMAESPLSENDS